ncbi:MAG: aminoglycoside phosphotransferase family protein, partial [Actinomycetota bacterium]|nr:aminoglycoside phosphotransferase family protein [Actinomycetota bacterium]
PSLLQAQEDAVLEGDELVHADVRSDNLCFMGPRTVLVDWNWAARGNGSFDAAAWASSLGAEGGPPPAEVLPDEPELAAMLCGYFASRAGLEPPSPGSLVREIQLIQLRAALPWAGDLLVLPPP